MPIYESDLKRILKPWVKELIMAGGSSAGPFLSGSGTTGRIVEFGAPTVIQDSSLIKSGAGLLTLASAGAYTLTVPATGTAVLGSGVANRLAVFTDANTLAQSYALTTVGDLMYMANQGSLETQTYYETSIYVNPSFTGTFTLSTLTFSRTIIAGDTISFDIDLYSQCDGFPTSSVLIAVRRGSSTGTIVASQTVTRDITRPPNPEDHWVATVVDSSPVQTYYITVTEQSAGFGMWFSSSARFIEGQLLSTDPIPARLPIGSEDQFLRVASGLPTWETVSVITGVSDTASVNLTVTGSTLSADVLPAGVDHNSLANLTVGDVHTQYALRARTITEGAGLAGNTYDLSANRTLAMGTPSTVTVSTTNSVSGTTHAHAATSSSNPGSAARLLASNSTGGLQLTRIGIGAAPITTAGMYNVYAISDPATVAYGIYNSGTMTLTAGGAKNFNGYYALAITTAAAGVVASNAAQLSSLNRNIFLAFTTHAVGYVAQSNAGQFEADNTSTGRVIEMAGNRISSGVNSGGGTVDINYGLLVEDQTVGATNYAIQTKGGPVVLNENGTAAGGFRAESDTEPSMIDLVASTDKLYMGGTTNGIEISKGGNLTLIGTATVYDDFVVMLANIKAPASDPPTWRAYKGTEVPAFGAANTNILYFTVQIPHRWKDGGVVEPHFHAAYPNANTGNSRWTLTYSWANIDGTFPTETSVSATFAAPGVADAHKLHSFGTISPTGKTGASVLLCSLARIGGDAADTYASDIYAISADFHIEIDKMGAFAAP